MKFALLYELQRAPGEPDYHARAVHEALEQISLADELGFDTVWTVEHHFLLHFSGSPCPEVFYGALSQRTKNIRLGLGVVILPYHHPVRVAERVAMLDILSDGRVEFGTGRSGPYEQTGMGIDPRQTRAMWDESLRAITQIWATEGEEFSFEGQFWQVPPRTVLPMPVQKPHPPIWVACLQPETYQQAASHGIGVLSFNANTPAAVEEHVKTYRQTVSQASPVGAFTNNQWANFTVAYCGEDNEQARNLGAQAIREFFGPGRPYASASANLFKDLLAQWGGEVPDHLRPAFRRFLEGGDLTGASGEAAVQAIWEQLDADTLADSGAIIAGDPESCIRGIEQHQRVGADQIIMIMQTATVPHDQAMRSIELVGKQVIPHFRRAEAEMAAATAGRPDAR